MLKKKRLSRGIRKYIRQQKARLRRGTLNTEEQKRQIRELYLKFISH